jgi:2-polyprenyl-3-methyl-5-hydroxy-6-metoxy-1,4-benzoquinol methylase
VKAPKAGRHGIMLAMTSRERRREKEARFAKTWAEALCLDGQDLRASAVRELAEHFQVDQETAAKRLATSEDDLAKEFLRRKLDAADARDLQRFYNEQDLEAFELMGYHVERGGELRGALKYVVALEVALRRKGRRYLDVGSGIGSGAILFARHGFSPTLCDIAEPLLRFARARLERRKIAATYVDMKGQDAVPDGSQDFMTCLDVLEHVPDPLGLLAWMRMKLAPGGLLAVFAAFGKDEDNPLHVVHDRSLHRRFRSLGFAEDRTAARFAYELGLRKLYFLTPTERSRTANTAIGVMDRLTPTWLRGLVLKMRGDVLS